MARRPCAPVAALLALFVFALALLAPAAAAAAVSVGTSAADASVLIVDAPRVLLNASAVVAGPAGVDLPAAFRALATGASTTAGVQTSTRRLLAGLRLSLALRGSLLLLGGRARFAANDTVHTLDAVERYYPASDAWVAARPLPAPRFDMAVAMVGAVVFVLGGLENRFPAPIAAGDPAPPTLRFDAVASDWLEPAAALPRPLRRPAVAVAGGAVYLTGGFVTPAGGAGAVAGEADLLRFDPVAGTWIELAAMPEVRHSHAMATAGGSLFVFGGLAAGVPVAALARYDISAGVWVTAGLPRPPRLLVGAALFTVQAPVAAYVCLAGGRPPANGTVDFNGGSAAVDCFHPANASWTVAAPLPFPLAYAQAACQLDTAWLVGGISAAGAYLTTVLRYAAARDAWETMPAALPAPGRAVAAAVALVL